MGEGNISETGDFYFQDETSYKALAASLDFRAFLNGYEKHLRGIISVYTGFIEKFESLMGRNILSPGNLEINERGFGVLVLPQFYFIEYSTWLYGQTAVNRWTRREEVSSILDTFANTSSIQTGEPVERRTRRTRNSASNIQSQEVATTKLEQENNASKQTKRRLGRPPGSKNKRTSNGIKTKAIIDIPGLSIAKSVSRTQSAEVLGKETQVNPKIEIHLDKIEESNTIKPQEEYMKIIQGDIQTTEQEMIQAETVEKQEDNTLEADPNQIIRQSMEQAILNFNNKLEREEVDLETLVIITRGILKDQKTRYTTVLEEIIDKNQVRESVMSIKGIEVGEMWILLNGEILTIGPIAIEGTPWECRNTLAFLALKEILPKLNAKKES